MAYLDDVIMNTVPVDPFPDGRNMFDGKHPCTLCGTDLSIRDLHLKLALRMKDVNRLADRVQSG